MENTNLEILKQKLENQQQENKKNSLLSIDESNFFLSKADAYKLLNRIVKDYKRILIDYDLNEAERTSVGNTKNPNNILICNFNLKSFFYYKTKKEPI